MKRLVRGACSLAVVAVMLFGIMGIENFKVEQRSAPVNIIETLSLEAAGISTADKTAGEDVNPAGLTVAAKAAILIDAGSGKVLFSQDADKELPPASVTKIMTMLLVLEACERGQISLDDTVTISERAASMGGSQMYMEVGEQHTVEELMQGVAMVSANDGCVALAEYLAGTVEIFVENMNKRAQELGMEHTNFVNTNGLPAPQHYTSARDISIMSRELLKYTSKHPWFTTWQATVQVGLPGKEHDFGLTNTNKLIKQYSGAIGIKTGYTSEAGYCLSAAAAREDFTLIAVVLGCETTKTRTAEVSKLLDYGFASYDSIKLAEKDKSIGAFEIKKGVEESVDVMPTQDISVLIEKGRQDSITTKLEAAEELCAPIEKGTRTGELIVYQDGKELARYELVAAENAEKATLLQLIKRLMDKPK